MQYPSWRRIVLTLQSNILNLLIPLVIPPFPSLKFLSKIVDLLLLSVLILGIVLSCTPVTSVCFGQLFKVTFPRIKLFSKATLFEALAKLSIARGLVFISFEDFVDLIVLNLNSWLMIYVLFHRSLDHANLLIKLTHVIWVRRMLLL